MKTVETIRLLIFCLIIPIILGGCSRKFTFQKSSVVPAAQLAMKIDHDKNDNYKIELKVENLVQPQGLTPSRNTYVVWVNSKQGNYNIGQLSISNKLNGSLTATTPYKPLAVIITAEDNPKATQPGTQVVLTSEEIDID